MIVEIIVGVWLATQIFGNEFMMLCVSNCT